MISGERFVCECVCCRGGQLHRLWQAWYMFNKHSVPLQSLNNHTDNVSKWLIAEATLMHASIIHPPIASFSLYERTGDSPSCLKERGGARHGPSPAHRWASFCIINMKINKAPSLALKLSIYVQWQSFGHTDEEICVQNTLHHHITRCC